MFNLIKVLCLGFVGPTKVSSVTFASCWIGLKGAHKRERSPPPWRAANGMLGSQQLPYILGQMGSNYYLTWQPLSWHVVRNYYNIDWEGFIEVSRANAMRGDKGQLDTFSPLLLILSWVHSYSTIREGNQISSQSPLFVGVGATSFNKEFEALVQRNPTQEKLEVISSTQHIGIIFRIWKKVIRSLCYF